MAAEAQEETTTESTEPSGNTEETQSDEQESIEAEARKEGWKPEEEWEGDGEWRDATEFVERGKDIHQTLSKNNKSLLSELKKVKDENKKVLAATTKIMKMHEQSKTQAVEDALRNAESQRQEAIMEGDLDRVSDIEKGMEKIKINAAPAQEPTPNFDTWLVDNPWYNDKKLQALANREGRELIADNEGLFSPDDPDFLEAVKESMEAKYPKHFAKKTEENPKRDQAQTVASSKRSSTSSKKTFNSLSKDEQDAFYMFEEEGLEITKEKWASKFNED